MNDEERLQELFLQHLQIDDSLFDPELTFEELGVDSLQQLELVIAVEDEFDISLDDEGLWKKETIGDAFGMILSRIREER